jgi:hypothetical protein
MKLIRGIVLLVCDPTEEAVVQAIAEVIEGVNRE